MPGGSLLLFGRGTFSSVGAFLLSGASLAFPSLAPAAGLELEVGRLVHPQFAIEGLRLEIGPQGAQASLAVDSLEVAERRVERALVDCSGLRLDAAVLSCATGSLTVPGLLEGAEIALRLDAASRGAELELRPSPDESLALSARPDGSMSVHLAHVAAARLVGWFPDLAAWQPAGRVEGRLDYVPAPDGRRLSASARVREAAFATADGLRAAEGIAVDVELDARAVSDRWEWRGGLDWSAGEAYVHPLYLTAGAKLDAAGRLANEALLVSRATLELAGVRSVAANGEFELPGMRLRRGAVAVAEAELATVGPRYLAPVLAPARAEQLHFTGRISAGIEIDEGEPVALDLAFDEAGFSLANGELRFGPVDGALPWRERQATDAQLTVGGGQWQKLTLGRFNLDARLDGRQLSIGRVAIPVLDGALVVSDLALRREAGGWAGEGSVVVEPISMPLLTEAVGLPTMAGVLSASMPGLRVGPGEVALDGALVVSVFEGYLRATNLRLLEPFGVAAHFYADVEARNLDLAQLTDTFAFGSITGFIDADVRGLELSRWRPVRFDARLASSPGRYPRRISQRAVENIGALGGAGAVVAIQRSFLGFFETFGYREIGLSCVLVDGVCHMDGLGRDAASGGFYIVRGGGIPALNVIGYNRRVDWNELVDRLQRVIESNTGPVIQ